MKWIVDPKTKEESISLTLQIVSFVAVIVASTLEMLGKAKDTSVFLELFAITSGLYFGRRIDLSKGKSIAAKEE